MPEAMLIFYRSLDGETDWEPLKIDEIPEWLKAPDVVGHLVAGEMAQADSNVLIPDEVRPWYRAEQVNRHPIQ